MCNFSRTEFFSNYVYASLEPRTNDNDPKITHRIIIWVCLRVVKRFSMTKRFDFWNETQNMENKTNIWLGVQPDSQMDPPSLSPPCSSGSNLVGNLQCLLMCKIHIHKANQPAIIHLCRTQSITHLATIRQGGVAAVSTPVRSRDCGPPLAPPQFSRSDLDDFTAQFTVFNQWYKRWYFLAT